MWIISKTNFLNLRHFYISVDLSSICLLVRESLVNCKLSCGARLRVRRSPLRQFLPRLVADENWTRWSLLAADGRHWICNFLRRLMLIWIRRHTCWSWLRHVSMAYFLASRRCHLHLSSALSTIWHLISVKILVYMNHSVVQRILNNVRAATTWLLMQEIFLAFMVRHTLSTVNTEHLITQFVT